MRRSLTPFSKTRSDHATETAEDYVEAIAEILFRQPQCRVKDLARFMEVSHVTVTRTLQRLTAEGLVDKAPYGPCVLTESGRRMARHSRQRHEIVLAFLRSIGVPEAEAMQDAEGMEHHVGRATLAAMQRHLDQHPGL
ncbi:MAG: manganese-binding transcriptional regulator MntR [Phycisphaerales bacterium]|nr:manganese-binding transcriptional regulator MntR [Phycisphaerales bacterium]